MYMLECSVWPKQARDHSTAFLPVVMERNSVVTYGRDLADAEPNHQDVNLFASKAAGHVTSLLNGFCITCCCHFPAFQITFLWLLFVGRNFPIMCHHGCRKI